MLDARSNWCQKFPFKRVIAAVTVIAFIATTVATDLAWAQPSASSSVIARSPSTSLGATKQSQNELNTSTFDLPQSLGTIKDSYFPSRKGSQRKITVSLPGREMVLPTIIHIQDAHCNYYAQHKINDIIDYISKEYGVDTINLEGGAREYDLSVFTNIADKNIRQKAADYFVREGLVNGAEYFAINNPDKTKLWGIEDTKLYIDNLRIYRDSLKIKDAVDKHIKSLDHILANLKRKLFPSALLELDTKYAAYKSGSLDFKGYLAYLIGLAHSPVIARRAKGPTKQSELKEIASPPSGARNDDRTLFNIKSFPNIYLLTKSLEAEEKINFNKANDERDKLISALQRMLSRNDMQELVVKTVEFKKENISQGDFYSYLAKKAAFVNLDLGVYPEFHKYLAYILNYDSADKSGIMTELARLEDRLRTSLYENDDQRELDLISKHLTLTKSLFAISLTKEDYDYYRKNEDAFETRAWRRFIERVAPLNGIDARLDDAISDLDTYCEKMSAFYDYSLKRDKAFLKNLRTGTRFPSGMGNVPANSHPGRETVTILITGGFHTENLCELFKKEGISYVSIMPNFKTVDGYDCQYFKLLSGEKSVWIKDILPSVLNNSMAVAAQLSPPMVEAMQGAGYTGRAPGVISAPADGKTAHTPSAVKSMKMEEFLSAKGIFRDYKINEGEYQPQQFYWVSNAAVTNVLQGQVRTSGTFNKPNGVWISGNHSWVHYCSNNKDWEYKLEYATPLKVQVKKNARILEIDSLESFKRIAREYLFIINKYGSIMGYARTEGDYQSLLLEYGEIWDRGIKRVKDSRLEFGDLDIFTEKIKKSHDRPGGYAGIHITHRGIKEVGAFRSWCFDSTVIFDPNDLTFSLITPEEKTALKWDGYHNILTTKDAIQISKAVGRVDFGKSVEVDVAALASRMSAVHFRGERPRSMNPNEYILDSAGNVIMRFSGNFGSGFTSIYTPLSISTLHQYLSKMKPHDRSLICQLFHIEDNNSEALAVTSALSARPSVVDAAPPAAPAAQSLLANLSQRSIWKFANLLSTQSIFHELGHMIFGLTTGGGILRNIWQGEVSGAEGFSGRWGGIIGNFAAGAVLLSLSTWLFNIDATIPAIIFMTLGLANAISIMAELIGLPFGRGDLAATGSRAPPPTPMPSAAMAGPVERTAVAYTATAADIVRKSPHAYSMPARGGFQGVDLEHFVFAQTKLAERNLSPQVLSKLLSRLQLSPNLTGEVVYQRILERLAEIGYSKDTIDLINGDTYQDPRLAIEIIGQNKNPRLQSVFEAVANSLDAHGYGIGQFGKGVKQVIDWLSANGKDRVDVFTRKENGKAYQLTIIKDTLGQYYIQIRNIPVARFQDAAIRLAGQPIEHGTLLHVSVAGKIPRTEKEGTENQSTSQADIVSGIHKRFPFVTSVDIFTRTEGQPDAKKVNGFETKTVIVPAGQGSLNHAEAHGKFVKVAVMDNSLTVVDNGKGMDSEIIARMFVPREGTKHPEPLSGQMADDEKKNVKVVYDRMLPRRVSFSRNGEVISAIDIPDGICSQATLEGGLSIELAGLMDVPESRDNVQIPLSFKAGEVSNFQKGIEYAVNQIIGDPERPSPAEKTIEKLKIINTIVAGLDGLTQGNANYEQAIKVIRGNIQKALAPLIERVRKEGVMILPHDRQFVKLALPKGKQVIFLHEKLFDWRGALSLKEIGANVVPGVILGDKKRLPLVVAAFTPQATKGILQFLRNWHLWTQDERLPVIKTDRFIAIPRELGQRVVELTEKRRKGLSQKEEKELASLLERVNIITGEEVVTSYEVSSVKTNLILAPLAQAEPGRVDTEAIDRFLSRPPVSHMPILDEAPASGKASFQDAFDTISKIDDNDPIGKISAITGIAVIQAKAGLLEYAKDTINRATNVAKGYDDPWVMAFLLTEIAIAQFEAGLKAEAVSSLEEAIHIAVNISNNIHRQDAARRIVIAEAKLGFIAAAKDGLADSISKTMKTFSVVQSLAHVITVVIEAQIKAGLIKEAVDMAAGFGDPLYSSVAFATIAAASPIESTIADSYFVPKAGRNVLREAVIDMNDIRDNTKVFALIAIAKAEAKNGLTAKLHNTFSEAVKIALKLKSAKDPTLSLIAAEQAKAGLTMEARMTILTIVDDSYKASALAAIATYYIKSDEISKAEKALTNAIGAVASNIAGPRKADALSDIAAAEAELTVRKLKERKAAVPPLLGEAIATAEKISDINCKARALAAIAVAQKETGSIEEAVGTMARAFNLAKIDEGHITLATIGAAMMKIGMTVGAKTTFDQAVNCNEIGSSSAENKAHYLSEVAVKQAEAGLSDDAKDTFAKAILIAEGIAEKQKRSSIFSGIAIAQAEAGLIDEAFYTLRKVSGDLEKARDIAAITKAQVKAGLITQAKGWIGRAIRLIKPYADDSNIFSALIPIAEAQIEAGLTQEAIETLSKADGIAFQFDDADRAIAFSRIAANQAKLGLMQDAKRKFASALTICARVTEGWQRERVFNAIIEAFIKSGLIANAVTLADGIPDQRIRSEFFANIAIAQAESGSIEDAIETLKKVGSHWDSQNVLQAIATAQAKSAVAKLSNQPSVLSAGAAADKATGFNVLTKAAKNIPSPAIACCALANIAMAQAEAGLMQEAKDTIADAVGVFTRLDDSIGEKPRALAKIAAAQLKAGLTKESEDNFTKAIDFAEAYPEERYMVLALTDIAMVQIEAGLMSEAQRLLEEALAEARRIPDALHSALALADVAVAYAKTKNIDGVQYTITIATDRLKRIADDAAKAAIIAKISTAEIEAGLTAQAGHTIGLAVNIVRKVADDRQKALAFCAIATAQNKAGFMDANITFALAVRTAHLIVDNYEKSFTLRIIAAAEAEAGLIDSAMERVRGITDDDEKLEAISAIELARIKLRIAQIRSGTEAQTIPMSETKEGREMLEAWSKDILPARGNFIRQAQAAYQPIIDEISLSVPDEFQQEILLIVKTAVESLYGRQEKAVLEGFRASLKGKPLELHDGSLPFDDFDRRAKEIMRALPGFLKALKLQLLQENHGLQAGIYRVFFSNLLELCGDFEGRIEDLNNDFLMALALGWKARTAEQVTASRQIIALISALRHSAGDVVHFETVQKIVETLTRFSEKDPAGNTPIIVKQLEKIFNLKPAARDKFLTDMETAFSGMETGQLDAYVENPQAPASLGKARPFVVFLTHEVEQVMPKTRRLPDGEDIRLPEGGIALSQIIKLEQQRPKKGTEDIAMDMDYLIQNLDNLPEPSDKLEAEIQRNVTVQRESGAYTAEITQNSRDATRDLEGELVVDFYLQNEGAEYVEEAADNGTGALKEIALMIPKSTKAAGGQLDLAGFFGTGKYTLFEGVDRLEIITKNKDRAFMFVYTVIKDSSGNPLAVRLTGIRKITDPAIARGVTVRRIKSIENTIPELDHLLAQRAWKSFAGLARDTHFTIYMIDNDGKKQALAVKQEGLSEVEFKVKLPGQEGKDLGALRLISAEDMPLQVVDRAGLRICEIKPEYLALVPQSLRKFVEKLGIIVQIPLPLIRNRSAFEHEDMYLPFIQKYVAIAFYRAIAYKAMTQTSPQFTFADFPFDWETNDDYWDSIDPAHDKQIIDMAEKINSGRPEEIRQEELDSLLMPKGTMDREQRVIRLILMLEVPTDVNKPHEKVSLLGRRLAVQARINKQQADTQKNLLEGAGLSKVSIPQEKDIPHYDSKLQQAASIERGHEQMRHVEDFVVDPKEYSAEEHELVEVGQSIGRNFDIEQVILLDGRVSFAGAFKTYKNKNTMFLSRKLALQIGKPSGGMIDAGTNTIVHELGHLLEKFAREDDTKELWRKGYVSHTNSFTHDATDGFFSEAMRLVSAVSLANHASGSAPAAPSAPRGAPYDNLYEELKARMHAWELRLYQAQANIAHAENVDEAIRLLNKLHDEIAQEEIDYIRNHYDEGARYYKELSDPGKPWDEGLDASEKPDEKTRAWSEKSYYHGTSLGMLMAMALIEGALGKAEGAEITRTTANDGYRVFFTAPWMYKIKNPTQDPFGYGSDEPMVREDGLAKAFEEAGIYASIATRKTRAVSLYYAMRIAREEAREKQKAGFEKDFPFPPVEYFLRRAVVKVDNLKEPEGGTTVYPEITTDHPVPLEEARVLLDDAMPIPTETLIDSRLIPRDDPENIVDKLIDDPRSGGGLANIVDTQKRRIKYIQDRYAAIGNRVSRPSLWKTVAGIFTETEMTGRVPKMLVLAAVREEIISPRSGRRADDLAPPEKLTDYAAVQQEDGSFVKSKLEYSGYESQNVLSFVSRRKDGIYCLHLGVRSQRNPSGNTNFVCALGNNLTDALAVYDYFRTREGIKKIDGLEKLNEMVRAFRYAKIPPGRFGPWIEEAHRAYPLYSLDPYDLMEPSAAPAAPVSESSRGMSGRPNEELNVPVTAKIATEEFATVEFDGNSAPKPVILKHEKTGENIGNALDSKRLGQLNKALEALNRNYPGSNDLKLLKGAKVLFIYGLDDELEKYYKDNGLDPPKTCVGTHYGLTRHQYYLDSGLLDKPEELAAHLHHEIQERHAVINGTPAVEAHNKLVAEETARASGSRNMEELIRGVPSDSDKKAEAAIRELNEGLPPKYDPLLAVKLYAAFNDLREMEKAAKQTLASGVMPNITDKEEVVDDLRKVVYRSGIYARDNGKLNDHLIAIIMFAAFHPDEKLRTLAIEAFGYIKESTEFKVEEVRKFLALNGKSRGEQLSAVESMGKNGDFRGLIEVLKSNPDEFIKSYTIRQIALTMNPESRMMIVPSAFSAEERDAVSAIRALKKLGDPQTILVFAALMGSDSVTIKDEARKALEEVGDMIIGSRMPLSLTAEEGIDEYVKEAKEELFFTHGKLADDHPATLYVRGIFREVMKGEADKYSVFIAPEWTEPDACAFPDGTIVLSGGLLQFIQYKEELQAVLSHEVTHIRRQHTLKLYQRAEKDRMSLGSILGTVGLRRAMEYESDMRWGIEDCNKLGVNPLGLLELMDKMSEIEKKNGVDLEHGSAADRARNVESIFYFLNMRALSHDLSPLPSESGFGPLKDYPKERTLFTAGPMSTSDEETYRRSEEARLKTAGSLPDTELGIAERKIKQLLKYEEITADELVARRDMLIKDRQDLGLALDDIQTRYEAKRTSKLGDKLREKRQAVSDINEELEKISADRRKLSISIGMNRRIIDIIRERAKPLEGAAAKKEEVKTKKTEKETPAVEEKIDKDTEEIIKIIGKGTSSTSRDEAFYRDVMGRISVISANKNKDEVIKFFCYLIFPPTDTSSAKGEFEIDRIISVWRRKAIKHDYLVFRLFEMAVDGLPQFGKLKEIEKNAMKAQAMIFFLDAAAADVSFNAQIKQDAKGSQILFDGSDIRDLQKYGFARKDIDYIVSRRRNFGEAWFQKYPGRNMIASLFKLFAQNPPFSSQNTRIRPLFAITSIRHDKIYKKIFAQILGFYLSQKQFLGWRNFFDEIKGLEELGVPCHEFIKEHKESFGVALAAVWREIPRRPSKDELRELGSAIGFVQSPFLRLTLQEYYYKHVFADLTFMERLDLLFSRETAGEFDLGTINDLIEKDAKTRDEIHAVIDRMIEKADVYTSEGSRGAGVAAFLTNTRVEPKWANKLIAALLESGKEDKKLHDVVYEKVDDYAGSAEAEISEAMDEDSSAVASEPMISLVSKVKTGEKILRLLYTMDGPSRYLLLRKILTGRGGLVSDPGERSAFLKSMIAGLVSEGNESDLRSIINEIAGSSGAIRTWSPLYFALQKVLGDKLGIPPQKSSRWEEVIPFQHIEAHYGKRLVDLEVEQYMKNEILKKSVLRRISPDNARHPWRYEEPILDFAESVLQQKLGALGAIEKRMAGEGLTPLSFVIELAQNIGALGVRFLQLVPQFVPDIPQEYEKAFSTVYDSVYGQSKLNAVLVLEDEWKGFWNDVDSIEERVGGGSLMTVYRIKKKEGPDEVVKVMNPNLLYLLKDSTKLISEMLDELERRHGKGRYSMARLVIETVNEWINRDVTFKGFLKDDARFKELNDGFHAEGIKGRMYVPRSFAIPGKDPDGAALVIREEFIKGRNLTEWDELVRSHDMKDVVSLIVRNYKKQLEDGLVHSDVHVGNFRVMENGDVAILDRNFFLKLDDNMKNLINEVLLRPEQLSTISAEAFLDKILLLTSTARVATAQRQALVDAAGKFLAHVRETGDFGHIASFLVELRQNGIKLPLEITLIIKNIGALNNMARKAGFSGGIVEAYMYPELKGMFGTAPKGGAMKQLGLDEDTGEAARAVMNELESKKDEIMATPDDPKLRELRARHVDIPGQFTGTGITEVRLIGRNDLGNIPAVHMKIGSVLFIILNNNLPPPLHVRALREEAVFHELHEALLKEQDWVKKLAQEAGITPQRVAHIIASNEQAAEFASVNGITPYHQYEIGRMSREELERLRDEDRTIHAHILKTAAERHDIALDMDYDELQHGAIIKKLAAPFTPGIEPVIEFEPDWSPTAPEVVPAAVKEIVPPAAAVVVVEASLKKNQLKTELESIGVTFPDGQPDFSEVDENADWVMNKMRLDDKNNLIEGTGYIYEETPGSGIPSAIFKYGGSFESFYRISSNEGSRNFYLTVAETAPGVFRPVVVKEFRRDTVVGADTDSSIAEELKFVQIYDQLGVGAPFYGVIRDENGKITGYALKFIDGEEDYDSNRFNAEDFITMGLAAGRIGIRQPPQWMVTKTGNFVVIDAGSVDELEPGMADEFIREHNLAVAGLKLLDKPAMATAPATVPAALIRRAWDEFARNGELTEVTEKELRRCGFQYVVGDFDRLMKAGSNIINNHANRSGWPLYGPGVKNDIHSSFGHILGNIRQHAGNRGLLLMASHKNHDFEYILLDRGPGFVDTDGRAISIADGIKGVDYSKRGAVHRSLGIFAERAKWLLIQEFHLDKSHRRFEGTSIRKDLTTNELMAERIDDAPDHTGVMIHVQFRSGAASGAQATVPAAEPKGDGIVGAASQGPAGKGKRRLRALQHIVERLRIEENFNLSGWVDEQKQAMDKNGHADRENLERALRAAGIPENKLSSVCDRIVVVDLPARIRPKGATKTRLGGAIARTPSGLKILFPRSELERAYEAELNAYNTYVISDLLHEVVELELITKIGDVDEAHWYAELAADALIKEGVPAANKIIELANSRAEMANRQGKFEMEFKRAVKEAIKQIQLPEKKHSILTDSRLQGIGEDFIGILRRDGWYVSDRFEEFIRMFLNRKNIINYIEKEKTAQRPGDTHITRSGIFDTNDLVLILQRLHTISADMFGFATTEEMVVEHSRIGQLHEFIKWVIPSNALKYSILKQCGLAGKEWEKLVPDREDPEGVWNLLANWKKTAVEGRRDEVNISMAKVRARFSSFSPVSNTAGIKNMLRDIKAVSEFFNIDMSKMAENKIMNLIKSKTEQNILIESSQKDLEKVCDGISQNIVDEGIFRILNACLDEELKNIVMERFVARGSEGITMVGRDIGDGQEEVCVKITPTNNRQVADTIAARIDKLVKMTNGIPYFAENRKVAVIPFEGRGFDIIEVNRFVGDAVNVREVIDNASGRGMGFGEVIDVAAQIIKGASFMHGLNNGGYVDTDATNLENFMLTRGGIVKLVDFGKIIPARDFIGNYKNLIIKTAIKALCGQLTSVGKSRDAITKAVNKATRLVIGRFGRKDESTARAALKFLYEAAAQDDPDLEELVRNLRGIVKEVSLNDAVSKAITSDLLTPPPVSAIIGAAHGDAAQPSAAEAKIDTIEARRAATLAAAADVTGRSQVVKVIAGVPCDLELRTKVGNTVLEINRELAKRGFGIIRVDDNYQSQEPDERQASTFNLDMNDPKATEESCKQAVTAVKTVMTRQRVAGQVILFAPVNLVDTLRKEFGDSVIVVPDAYSDCDAGKGWYTDVVARVVLGRLIAAIKDLDNKEKETGVKNDELRSRILDTMSDYLAGISENKNIEDIKDARNLIDLLNALSSGLRIRPVDYNKNFKLYRESQVATAVSA